MINLVLFSVLYIWVFYCLYIFTMGVYRAHLAKRLTTVTTIMLFPVVLLAIFVDILCNFTLATIIFWELPHQMMVTQRLHGYRQQLGGWRKSIADYICLNLLDPFDPSGDHC